MFSDVGPLELVTLVVLAVLLFGPNKLPEMIQNVAGFIQKVREFSESTKQEVRSELGPEFNDFEFEDLHPKTFVRKHLLDDGDLGLGEIRSALDPSGGFADVADAVRASAGDAGAGAVDAGRVPLTKAEQLEPAARSAFDPDAT
ncbi:sec-independent translocase [Streptomyces sp. CA-142005]|uniref:sec-independent translocase n=1 Tax=Streptomyces sp. CA-142005 TaxID=3240052 RepID=UPI003D8B0C23